jgi:glycerol kinase
MRREDDVLATDLASRVQSERRDMEGGMGEGLGATGKVVLALDTGTTSGRALVIDASGTVLASAQQEVGLSTPESGWVEQDAEELWQAQLATARAALEKAGVPAAEVAGLGIANQRETTIVWDRATSEAVAPAIVWQDRRTAGFCEDLRLAGVEAQVRRKTGLLLDPYFSGTKLRWLLDNVPGVRERAEAGELAFGTVDSWMAWRLSGGRRHVTDATNASRTSCWRCSGCRARCCPRSATAAASSRSATPRCSAPPSPSPASPAISRPRSSDRPAHGAA